MDRMLQKRREAFAKAAISRASATLKKKNLEPFKEKVLKLLGQEVNLVKKILQ